MKDFVHLRVHSDYTVSEGASKITDLVSTAKSLGFPALGLADKNNISGAFTFSAAAADKGVQPLIGCQLYMALEKDLGTITLFAQNEIGYQNICRLLKDAHQPKPGPKGDLIAPSFPVVDPEALDQYSEGIILLTGDQRTGLLPKLAAIDTAQAAQMYNWLLHVFGDRMYVEIERTGRDGEIGSDIENVVIDLAYGASEQVLCKDGIARNQAPLVATSEVWYDKPERHEPWLLLQAVRSKNVVSIEGDHIVEEKLLPSHHMRSMEEMEELFGDLPEALRNTSQIAQRCAFKVGKRASILPPFATKGGRTEEEELRAQALEGLKKRLDKAGITGQAAEIYWQRIDFELSVIEKMQFPGYFLIVSDFIKWAKNNDIPVGPGRGSGAGSVVAWALTITDLNPLEFGLLFERFLNPERVSMPDFDIDFCQDRRDEVVHYVRKRYGEDYVAKIMTLGSFKSKGALKDMARVIIHQQFGDYKHHEINDVTKMLPDIQPEEIGLDDHYETIGAFRDTIDSSDKMRLLFDRAKSIEHLNRGTSVHAAGVVIGDRPLCELLPITYSPVNDVNVCGYTMSQVEKVGLVKFDFLGLTTLSIIKLAQTYIKQGRGLDLDMETIPKNDPRVFELFSAGMTTGVFQFESAGMRDTLKKMRPDRLEDLIATVALYRPGPMENIPEYCARKHGQPWEAPHSDIQSILDETYGIMVYQEQVMQISQAMAGYSLGAADMLRRAMGKKIRAEMDAQKKIFVDGSTARGVDKGIAVGVFDMMAKFADYGFNKSHAAAYAWIPYQTMYLKVHYPVEFFAALMTYNADTPEKLSLIKEELDVYNIKLLPPDISKSFPRFSPEPSDKGHDGFAIRFGLGGIKSVSGDLKDFLKERDKNGDFLSLEDFYSRAGKFFNKGKLQSLAEAGAFDRISKSRQQAFSVLSWLSDHKSKAPVNQTDMFGSNTITIPAKILDVAEWPDAVTREFNAVGFYISSHPIDNHVPRLTAAGVRRRMSFENYMTEKNLPDMRGRKLCCMVDDVKVRQTARGVDYVMAWVSERGDKYSVSCYPNENMDMLGFKNEFELAKKSRAPIVIMADFSVSDDEKRGRRVFINGRNVWSMDRFLANVRGDMVIEMNSSQMPNNHRISAADREQAKAHDDSDLSESSDPAPYNRAILKWLDARIKEVGDFMQEHRSNDEKSIKIRIDCAGKQVFLPGRYSYNSEVEWTLKTFDGIGSIKEDLPAPVRLKISAEHGGAELAPRP